MVMVPDGAEGSGASGSARAGSVGVAVKIALPCALLGLFGAEHGAVLTSRPYGAAGSSVKYWQGPYSVGATTPVHQEVRFSAPVYPGETIVVEMWRDGPVISFEAKVAARGVTVIKNGKTVLRG